MLHGFGLFLYFMTLNRVYNVKLSIYVCILLKDNI